MQRVSDPSRYLDPYRQIVKSDVVYYREAMNLIQTNYTDQNYIRQGVDRAVEIGLTFAREIENYPMQVSLCSRESITQTILQLRQILRAILYFETTNGLIYQYRTQIGIYAQDLIPALQKAKYLKEKYDAQIAESKANGQGLLNYMNYVRDNSDARLASLYDTFVDAIPEVLAVSLNQYKNTLNSNDYIELNYTIYQDRNIASDPIFYLYQLES